MELELRNGRVCRGDMVAVVVSDHNQLSSEELFDFLQYTSNGGKIQTLFGTAKEREQPNDQGLLLFGRSNIRKSALENMNLEWIERGTCYTIIHDLYGPRVITEDDLDECT